MHIKAMNYYSEGFFNMFVNNELYVLKLLFI